MSDKIPGSSFYNPIQFGNWHIYLSDAGEPHFHYAYVHEDWDGAEDSGDTRCGAARSISECETEIMLWEQEHGA